MGLLLSTEWSHCVLMDPFQLPRRIGVREAAKIICVLYVCLGSPAQ